MDNDATPTTDRPCSAAREAHRRDATWRDVGELYGRYYESLIGTARRYAVCDSTAEDAVQDACIKLAMREDATPIAKPLAYLRTMVINEIRTTARSEVRRRHLQKRAADPIVEVPSVEGEAIACVDLDAVEQAMESLSERQAEVIGLRYFAGLSESETADRLGIGAGSVKTHSWRGRKALQLHLAVSAA